MHGYGIMREVAVRSNGTWRLSPGAVYPTLNALEADGFVTATGDSGRSVYELTERGRSAAAELAGDPPPWETHDDDQLAELGQAVEALAVAARQIAEVGETRQQADAVAVLVQARRRLYALLAQEPGTEPAGDDQP
jgi:DNA-binding PadR family transcriptional regulator